jgi:hypothetical protein
MRPDSWPVDREGGLQLSFMPHLLLVAYLVKCTTNCNTSKALNVHQSACNVISSPNGVSPTVLDYAPLFGGDVPVRIRSIPDGGWHIGHSCSMHQSSSQPQQIFQPRQEGFYSVQGLSSPVAASRKNCSAILTAILTVQSLRHLPR